MEDGNNLMDLNSSGGFFEENMELFLFFYLLLLFIFLRKFSILGDSYLNKFGEISGGFFAKKKPRKNFWRYPLKNLERIFEGLIRRTSLGNFVKILGQIFREIFVRVFYLQLPKPHLDESLEFFFQKFLQTFSKKLNGGISWRFSP